MAVRTYPELDFYQPGTDPKHDPMISCCLLRVEGEMIKTILANKSISKLDHIWVKVPRPYKVPGIYARLVVKHVEVFIPSECRTLPKAKNLEVPSVSTAVGKTFLGSSRF